MYNTPNNGNEQREKHKMPESDFMQSERMETDDAEARMHQQQFDDAAKKQDVAANSDAAQKKLNRQEVNAKVMDELKKDLKYEASIAPYLDQILITVSQKDFDKNTDYIQQQVQQIVNHTLMDGNHSVCIIIRGNDSHKEKKLKIMQAQ